MEGSSAFGLNSLIPQTYKSKAEAFAKCLQDKLMLLGGLNETETVKKRLNEELNGNNKKPEENFPYDITKYSEDNIFVQHPESIIKRDVGNLESRNVEMPKTNGKLKYIKDRRGYSSDSEESDREDLYKTEERKKADDCEFYQNGSETSDLVLNSHKQSELLHKRVHELINGNNEKNKEPNRKLVSFSSEETNDSWHSCDDHDAYDSDDNDEVDYFASQIKGSPKLRSTKHRKLKRGKDDEWKKSRANYSPVIPQDVFADFDAECFSPAEDPEESEQLLGVEDAGSDRNLILLDGVDMENYDVPYRILRESSSANNLEKHFSQGRSEIDPIMFGGAYVRKKEVAATPASLKPPSPEGYSHLLTPPPSPEVNRDEVLASGDYVMNMRNLEEANGDYEELREEEEDADDEEEFKDERILTEIAEDEEDFKEVVKEVENVEEGSAEDQEVGKLGLEDASESIRTDLANEELETEEQGTDDQKVQSIRNDSIRTDTGNEMVTTDIGGSIKMDFGNEKVTTDGVGKDGEGKDGDDAQITNHQTKEINIINAANELTTLTDTIVNLEQKEEDAKVETDDNEVLEEPIEVEKVIQDSRDLAEDLAKVEERNLEESVTLGETKSAIKTGISKDINYADVITEPLIDQTDQVQEIEPEIKNFCSTFTKKGGMILECPCDNLKLPTLELFTPEESQICSIEVHIDNEEELNEEQNQTLIEESNESGNSLEVPKTKSEDDDNEEELSPRLKLRRCSSLKTWKTPPGTPGRKKIVRFADALGLDLADVRTFLDEIPKIPSSAYEDLNYDLNSDPFSSCHCPAPQLPTMPTLIPMFPQPGGQIDFLERLKTLNIILESAVLTDTTVLTISGIIRVRNLDFNKSVHVRYTLDNWVTIADLQATYVPNSCDGFSDKFSFVLYGHTLKIGQKLEFALRLECLGCQYWDNNAGKNYVFECLPQSPSTAVYTPLSSSPSDSWTSKFY